MLAADHLDGVQDGLDALVPASPMMFLASPKHLAGMHLGMRRVGVFRVETLAHATDGRLGCVPFGMVNHQSAEDEGVGAGSLPAGIAAFIAVEEVHASLEAGSVAAATVCP